MTLIIPEKIITNIRGTAIPKPANDQNTDDIIPARYLKEITFKNMGSYVYIDERYKDGQIVKEHPFNDERYKGAKIVIGGANYGCGSSREHAPQALHRYGIDAVIAESFGEIFAGNSVSLGLVGVTIPSNKIAELVDYIQIKPTAVLDIDLNKKLIEYDGHVIEFDMPEGRRQAFMNGTWDAMAILQQNQEGINKIVGSLEYLKFKL